MLLMEIVILELQYVGKAGQVYSAQTMFVRIHSRSSAEEQDHVVLLCVHVFLRLSMGHVLSTAR